MFLLSTSNVGVSLVSAQGVAMACSWRWPQCHRGLVQCCFNFRISKFKPFHPVFIPIPMLYPMLYPLDHLQHLWPAEALNFLKLVRMRCHPQSHAQSMLKGQLWRPKRGKMGIIGQHSHLFSTIITGLSFLIMAKTIVEDWVAEWVQSSAGNCVAAWSFPIYCLPLHC